LKPSGCLNPKTPCALQLFTRTPVLLLLWILSLAYAARFITTLPPKVSDFNHFYVGALSFRHGINAYVTHFDDLSRQVGLDVDGIRQATYPPTFYLAFEALTLLGPRSAYWTWMSLSGLSFALALYLIVSAELRMQPRMAALFGALVLLYPATYEHFHYGQPESIFLLLLVLMLRWLHQGRDAPAGFALAIAAMLKGFPVAIAGYLLCRSRWRALIWTAVGCGIITALSIWGLGVRESLSFSEATRFLTSEDALSKSGNISINGIASRLFWFFGAYDSEYRPIAVIFGDLAIISLTIYATVISVASGHEDSRAFSLWIVTMILLSPTAWPEYMILFVLPFAVILQAASQGEAPARALWAMVLSYAISFSRHFTVLLAGDPALRSSAASAKIFGWSR